MKYRDLLQHLLASPENVVENVITGELLRFREAGFQWLHASGEWVGLMGHDGQPFGVTPQMADGYEIPKPKPRTWGPWEECTVEEALCLGDGAVAGLSTDMGAEWSVWRCDGRQFASASSVTFIPVRPIKT